MKHSKIFIKQKTKNVNRGVLGCGVVQRHLEMAQPIIKITGGVRYFGLLHDNLTTTMPNRSYCKYFYNWTYQRLIT